MDNVWFMLLSIIVTGIVSAIATLLTVKFSGIVSKELEVFKQDFDERMSRLERVDKYELAALDKRLEAHQKAFGLARRLVMLSVQSPLEEDREAKIKLNEECERFTDEWAIYSRPEVLSAFRIALNHFMGYHGAFRLLRDHTATEDMRARYKESIHESADAIERLPRMILEAFKFKPFPASEDKQEAA
jgi:hypothetical protein